jgi:4-hydroxy-tetrahydrodipicolinate synthase
MPQLRGVIAATPTPVKENLAADFDRLLKHCFWLLEKGGCDGINLLGTTGEATSFSVEERLETMKAVAASGLPLERTMAGTGAAALADAVRLTRAARDLGFAGALLLPPFYYKGIEDAAVVRYVETLVARAGKEGLRLYLYHIPKNTAVPYGIEVVARLRDALPETVVGIKDSSGDLDNSRALVRRLPGFGVFPGSEFGLAEPGFAGCISATTNVNGPIAQRAWRKSGSEEGRRIVAEAMAIRDALSQYQLVGSVKWALADLKGDPAWRRPVPPLSELDAAQAATLRAALAGTAYAELRAGESKLATAGE